MTKSETLHDEIIEKLSELLIAKDEADIDKISRLKQIIGDFWEAIYTIEDSLTPKEPVVYQSKKEEIGKETKVKF
jgi:flagellin-specific chaperone FliS